MMRVAADASVVVKWLLPVRDDEEDLEQALDLLRELIHLVFRGPPCP